jgi:hypothetical protein
MRGLRASSMMGPEAPHRRFAAPAQLHKLRAKLNIEVPRMRLSLSLGICQGAKEFC